MLYINKSICINFDAAKRSPIFCSNKLNQSDFKITYNLFKVLPVKIPGNIYNKDNNNKFSRAAQKIPRPLSLFWPRIILFQTSSSPVFTTYHLHIRELIHFIMTKSFRSFWLELKMTSLLANDVIEITWPWKMIKKTNTEQK